MLPLMFQQRPHCPRCFMSRSLPFPSREVGLALHHLLLEGAPSAPLGLCAAYLEPLRDWLARVYPRADAHLRTTAAHQALLGYFARPAGFDPARLDLAAFLRL